METLRFVTFLAPNMFGVYQSIAEYVGKCLGMPVRLSMGTTTDVFEGGEADVGFLCGLPYIRLARQVHPPMTPIAAPVLQGARYHNQPIYFSDVIVRRDSPYHAFSELRGCAWAYNVQDSQSGYGITRYSLLKMGETNGFFGRAIEAGWHQKALRMVMSGAADASAIDSQVLAIEYREQPALADTLRVVDMLGPSTIQPIVVNSSVSVDMRNDILAALLTMGADPSARRDLDAGFIARFTPIADADYDDIRAMEEACVTANFTLLR